MSSSCLTAADLLQERYWFLREDRLFQIDRWQPEQPLEIRARAADTDKIHLFTLTELFATELSTQLVATALELG